MSTCAPCNGTQTSSVSVSQHGNRYKISRLYSLRLLREHLVNSSSKRRIVLAIDTRGRACVYVCAGRLRAAVLIDGGCHTRAGMCGDPKNISTCSPAKRVGESSRSIFAKPETVPGSS